MARKNGWQTPFHLLQVLTWVVFPTIMALFFVFYTPLLQTTAAYIGTVAYAAACLFTVYSVVICTKTDPSDDCILRPSTINRDTRAGDDQVYCNVCMQYVHKESRHCRLCDKCVAVFDHHCKWLNNCVGQKNYRHFLASVGGATTLLVLQLALGAYVFWETFTHPDDVRRRAATAFGCSTTKDATTQLCADNGDALPLLTIKLVHGVMLAFLVPWCFLIAQLTFFHIHLCIENLTTYDYIVRKRKRQMNRERGGANATGASWWQRLCACFQPSPSRANTSDGDKTQNASHGSGGSVPSDDDDALAAIEAEVDDDLEVLSARSGEVGERDSHLRSSSSSNNSNNNARARKSRGSFTPMRGFGLHVNLAAVTSGGATTGSLNGAAVLNGNGSAAAAAASGSAVIATPTTGSSTANYVLAPQTPRSPRSDAESAYHSDDSETNQPLAGVSVDGTSSMVMYGRPTPTDSLAHHIV